jgi:succinyl-CoA synthetase alpha subunit
VQLFIQKSIFLKPFWRKKVSIFVDKNTRVLVQGITGREGQFHARQCINYGSRVVAGVTPGKAGQKMDDVPVFNTVLDAVDKTGANCSLIFVPPPFAADAIMEAIDAEIDLIVAITEGIPVMDDDGKKLFGRQKNPAYRAKLSRYYHSG